MTKRILIFAMILLLINLPVNVSAQKYSTKDEVYNVIIDNLLAHKETFTIRTSVKALNQIGKNTDLFEAVLALDDEQTSKDADYLGVSVSSWRQSWSWSSLGGTATLTFKAVYRTTLKQENKVDAKIKSVLDNLKLENASDYKKVKAIHDYIVKRVSYDQTLKKHSAYNALINKSSVCEGYAAAAYRMLTDLGIECRIITGVAGGGPHAWNIVQVDGTWYNLDLTWDDPITNTGEQVLRYDYFLKNDEEFSDHIRDEEYNTQEFLNAYPIAEESYSMNQSSSK
jgi:transglutaminase/protease-like cytokinesis protein 3